MGATGVMLEAAEAMGAAEVTATVGAGAYAIVDKVSAAKALIR